MNRETKRKMKKALMKATGISQGDFDKYFSADSSKREYTDAVEIAEGSKVKIDIEKVVNRPRYNIMSSAYKKFVEEHHDDVFTAHVYARNMIEFEEDKRFLFWSGDLVVVSDEEESGC